jgi:hypothetical protein
MKNLLSLKLRAFELSASVPSRCQARLILAWGQCMAVCAKTSRAVGKGSMSATKWLSRLTWWKALDPPTGQEKKPSFI